MFTITCLLTSLLLPCAILYGKTTLEQQYCEPCHGKNIKKLSSTQINALLKNIPGQWRTDKDDYIYKTFTFKNHQDLQRFIHHVALICENEGHHSNFEISNKTVSLIIYTHAIKGLSTNDFILATKIMKYAAYNKKKQLIDQNSIDCATNYSCKPLKKWSYAPASNSTKIRSFKFNSFLSCIKKTTEAIELIETIQNQYKVTSYSLNIQFNQLHIKLTSENQNFSESKKALILINELMRIP